MKNTVYIFDIDGTLADCSHRVKYVDGSLGYKDWDKFYGLCGEDKPIEDVCRIFREIGYDIICVTGRTEKYRDKTEKWLIDNDLPCSCLFMRPDGDHRPDYVLKREIYEKQIKDDCVVLGVFEDRTQVVEMWRNLGLTCFQVASGNY